MVSQSEEFNLTQKSSEFKTSTISIPSDTLTSPKPRANKKFNYYIPCPKSTPAHSIHASPVKASDEMNSRL